MQQFARNLQRSTTSTTKLFLSVSSKRYATARHLSSQSHSEELLLSASRGQPLTGATSQKDLVQRMSKAGILTNPTAVQAMSSICRSNFVNQAKKKILVFGGNEKEVDVDPFDNSPIPLGHGGATISTPQFHGEVVEALAQSLSRPGSTALDIGTGTGYLACVFAQMIGSKGKVVGVDALEPLVEKARVVTDSLLKEKEAAPVEFQVAADLHSRDDHQPTFDTIYCAPAVTSMIQVKNLSRLLNIGGTLVVPLNNMLTGEQRLLKVKKEEGNISHEDIGPVACQPVLEGAALSLAREPPLPPPNTRKEELKEVKELLSNWTKEFETENGRRPTREDLDTHPVGSVLFKRFTTASKIGSV